MTRYTENGRTPINNNLLERDSVGSSATPSMEQKPAPSSTA
ncbi:IS66 family transposase [Ensifer sp. LCM 4579]|nr:IS66 family transposase [Ensifer sp. LCM 4579]